MRTTSVILLLTSLTIAACAREEKLVRYKPWFAGLEGAEINRQVAIPTNLRTAPTGGGPEDQLRTENPDQSFTLLAKTGRQLMIHIYTTLAENERDLFTKEVLSEDTRAEYHRQGLDPALPQADIHLIKRMIPHRYPFLLIDRVVSFEVNRFAIGIKNVTVNEPHCEGHFPLRAVMPGVLII